VFDAIMRMKPRDLSGTSISECASEIRKIAKSKIDELWEEWKLAFKKGKI
jgi:hypothetical protein